MVYMIQYPLAGFELTFIASSPQMNLSSARITQRVYKLSG